MNTSDLKIDLINRITQLKEVRIIEEKKFLNIGYSETDLKTSV